MSRAVAVAAVGSSALISAAPGQVGGLAPPVEITSSLPNTQRALGADLDGDGLVDIAALGGDPAAISWYQNLSHAAPLRYSRPSILLDGLDEANSFYAGDLSGDGWVDFVVGSAARNEVKLYLGLGLDSDGTPTFGGAVSLVDGTLGADVRVGPRLRAADLDGDGDQDLIVPNDPEAVSLFSTLYLENLGSGTFATATRLLGTGAASADVLPVDLDGDGDLDLVQAGSFGVQRWHENVGGSFQARALTPSFAHCHQAEAGDLDGDGDLDLVFTRHDRPGGSFQRTYVYENLGAGAGFGPVQSSQLDALEIALVDVNRDGALDLATAILGPGGNAESIAWFEYQAGGGFGQRNTLATGAFASVTSVVATDVTGDGQPDLLFGQERLGPGFVASTPPSAPLAFAASSFSLATQIVSAASPLIRDVTGDGRPDVLALQQAQPFLRPGQVFLSAQAAVGEFSLPVAVATDLGSVQQLRSEDLDGDGLADVLVENSDRELRAAFSEGGGDFSSGIVVGTLGSPAPLSWAPHSSIWMVTATWT